MQVTNRDDFLSLIRTIPASLFNARLVSSVSVARLVPVGPTDEVFVIAAGHDNTDFARAEYTNRGTNLDTYGEFGDVR